jgi:hypothetical protein
MAKRIRVRFIRRWQDLDWVFEVGDEITLPAKEVEEVRERMRVCSLRSPTTSSYGGKTTDLCQYGYHVVPLSFLEEIRGEEGD